MIFPGHHWKLHVFLIKPLKNPLAISSARLEIPYPQPSCLVGFPFWGKCKNLLHQKFPPAKNLWKISTPNFYSLPPKSQLPLPPFPPPLVFWHTGHANFDFNWCWVVSIHRMLFLVKTTPPPPQVLTFGNPSPAKFPIPPNWGKIYSHPLLLFGKPCFFFEPAIFFLHYAKYQENS